MQKLMLWLETEVSSVRETAGFIFLAAMLDVALFYTVRAALINWGIVEYTYDPDPQNPFRYFNTLMFVSLLVQAPILEEMLFRFVPLTIVTFFTKKPHIVLTTVVLFATLFGAIHPYDMVGRSQVAISGIVFGAIFLKCGGLQGLVVRGWLCAVAAHSASNLFLLAYDYYEYLERVL